MEENPPSADCGVTVASCTMSDASPASGQAVALSGMAGQVQGPGGDGMVKIAAGFRDASGHWAGGEPVVVSSTMPGEGWQTWAGGDAVIEAPSDPGTYHLWVRAVPAFSDAVAIQGFKTAVATGVDPQDAKWSEPLDVTPSLLNPIYRFWSPVFSHHFYTMDEAERDKLIEDYPDVWTFEGVAFHAYADATQPGVAPVYRFWSGSFNGHFYTMDQSERDKLIDNYPGVWTYEGVAFYAYAAPSEPIGSHAVHRFWSGTLNGHFYTTDEDEKDKLLTDYPHVWTYEGIAWYVVDP